MELDQLEVEIVVCKRAAIFGEFRIEIEVKQLLGPLDRFPQRTPDVFPQPGAVGLLVIGALVDWSRCLTQISFTSPG